MILMHVYHQAGVHIYLPHSQTVSWVGRRGDRQNGLSNMAINSFTPVFLNIHIIELFILIKYWSYNIRKEDR